MVVMLACVHERGRAAVAGGGGGATKQSDERYRWHGRPGVRLETEEKFERVCCEGEDDAGNTTNV